MARYTVNSGSLNTIITFSRFGPPLQHQMRVGTRKSFENPILNVINLSVQGPLRVTRGGRGVHDTGYRLCDSKKKITLDLFRYISLR